MNAQQQDVIASDRLQKLSESQTLAMSKRVRELIAAGRDVIGLTLGEPDFDTPVHIRNAAIEAIRESFTHYPPVAGIPELRQAVADKFKREYGLDFSAANVVVSTGAKQSLVNTIMSLVNPGQRVLLPAPYWVSYYEMFKMADAEIHVLPTDIQAEYKLSPAQLEAAITPHTRLMLLNSPNNPTGSIYTRDELAALVEVLARHPQVYVISDEIYEYITYDTAPTCLASFDSIRDRVIVVNGVSKGFAMTGWRIGYIVAPKPIAALCEKFQGQVTSGASSISQRAALAALTGPLDPTWKMRDAFRARRDYVAARLEQIPGLKGYLPEGAFYFYPDFSEFFGRTAPNGERMDDIDSLARYLLDTGDVALISGTAFGTNEHMRISYAYAQESLEKALDRIQSALAALK